MDTPSSESSTGPLNESTAADAFHAHFSPPEVVEKSADALEAEAIEELRKGPEPEDKTEPDPEVLDPDDDTVTFPVDGKSVTLKKSELAENYKNGLRQEDYTKKTMEAADVRKGAEAETAKAQQDRQNYANNLQRMAAQLEGGMQQQQNIDWTALLEADPVEYMRQQHLFNQRQAAYRENLGQQQQIRQQHEAEQATSQRTFLQGQQEELLAKLPDWKDPAKASAEKAALKNYLIKEGFNESNIDGISDHKAVILGRKAMLYDQMMDKARAASKKVQALPTKVVRPGVGESPNLDRQSATMQKLGKSGRVEDAAAVFSNYFS